MRILIIRPRDRLRYPRLFARLFRIQEVGLLMIAESIRNLADVVYVDENYQDIPDSSGFDVVLISVQTHLAPRAYYLAEYFRTRKKTVILGGPHVTLCPEESLLHADSIVIGPGDHIIRDVVCDIKKGTLRRIYDGKPWHSHFISPYYGLIQSKALYELLPVIISRGCQHKCSHCVIATTNCGQLSTRDANEVLADISRIKSSRFYFVDDNLLANRQTLLRVLRYLARYPRHYKWAGQITTQIIRDKEVMDLLEPSGCKLLFIGFDSLQEVSLRQVGSFKASQKDLFAQTVSKSHALGISVIGSFMFGLDGDKPGDIVSCAKEAIDVGLDIAAFNIFTPIPGTNAYDRYVAQGRIFNYDLSQYDFKNVVFTPKHFSPSELLNEFNEATRVFYGLKSILRRIPKMRNKRAMIPFNLLYNMEIAKLLHLQWRRDSLLTHNECSFRNWRNNVS